MRKRNNPVSYLVIAVFFLALSMIMVYALAANAATVGFARSNSGNAVALHDGECVIETINGGMYVGTDVQFSIFENFVTMKEVRYPEGIIELAIPTRRIVTIYTVSNTE